MKINKYKFDETIMVENFSFVLRKHLLFKSDRDQTDSLQSSSEVLILVQNPDIAVAVVAVVVDHS